MKILKLLSLPFVAIGSFLLMAWYFVGLGEAKERDNRHQESLKQKEKNKKTGARLEKEYEKLDASDVTNRLNSLR